MNRHRRINLTLEFFLFFNENVIGVKFNYNFFLTLNFSPILFSTKLKIVYDDKILKINN